MKYLYTDNIQKSNKKCGPVCKSNLCKGKGVSAYPGVGQGRPGEEERHKAYYQWVSFMLFLQVSNRKDTKYGFII